MGLVEDVIIGPYSGQQGRGLGPRNGSHDNLFHEMYTQAHRRTHQATIYH